MLSILGLLDTPTAGAYALAGRDVARLGAAERSRIRNREIGFIFQNFNLIGRGRAGDRGRAFRAARRRADGNLDKANGELVMDFLAELHAAGSTIVMVTHDRRFNRFATRTIELLDGAIATATATVQEKVAALP